MLAIERRNAILGKLQKERRVVVSELARLYGVSEETIRRDLDRLEAEGFAIKSYGGAVINEEAATDLPFQIRNKRNVQEKQCIAELVSALVEDGDSLVLDASSTALYIVRRLKEKQKKNLTIITNSVEILIELYDAQGWKVLSSGGEAEPGYLALFGPQTDRMLEYYHVDKAFISCKGIDMESGMTDANELLAKNKRTMLGMARERYLAVDSSKFGRIAFTKIGEFKDLTAIITDTEPDERWQRMFADAGIKCIYGSS